VAKIRRYSARLSRIIVLLFNKLITKLTILSGQEKKTYLFAVQLVTAYKITYIAGYLLPRIADLERIMTIF